LLVRVGYFGTEPIVGGSSLAKSFRSDIRVIFKRSTAYTKSIFELLVLGIGCGTVLDFVAHGPVVNGLMGAGGKSRGSGRTKRVENLFLTRLSDFFGL
jgi:hypothetical protein